MAFANLSKVTRKNALIHWLHKRSLSNAQVNNALRPFLFLVHPDLFGKYPELSKVNQESLKALHHHLSSFDEPQTKAFSKKSVTFYARPTGTALDPANIRPISVDLESNARCTVLSALKSADLPTEYVDKIARDEQQQQQQQQWWEEAFESREEADLDLIRKYSEFLIRRAGLSKKAPNNDRDYPLKSWLSDNSERARGYIKDAEPVLLKIEKYKSQLAEECGLAGVKCHAGMRPSIRRNTLRNLVKTLTLKPRVTEKVAAGKVILFHPTRCGISTENEIILSPGDVPEKWFSILENIGEGTFDEDVRRKPELEAKVSEVLAGIKFARREFQPPVRVDDYNRRLESFYEAFKDSALPPSWPQPAHDFELVLDVAGGSDMFLLPSGQLLCSADVLASHFFDSFSAKKFEEAARRLSEYRAALAVEPDLTERTARALGLISLSRGDGVGAIRMVKCCRRLLRIAPEIRHLTHGNEMNAALNYSLMTDGQIQFPWSFNDSLRGDDDEDEDYDDDVKKFHLDKRRKNTD